MSLRCGGDEVLNFANRTLYWGDNLPFLQGLNSATVDLIVTDPPFNTGRSFQALEGSVMDGAGFSDQFVTPLGDFVPVGNQKALQVIQLAGDVVGKSMENYLRWLGGRLMECHRILKPTGSLYLHIDHTAHAWVKCLLDSIFGAGNFLNEIAWCYTSPGNVSRFYPRKHDIILFYSKTEGQHTFNKDAVRVPYKRPLEGNSYGTIFQEHDLTRIAELSQIGKVVEDWWADIVPATQCGDNVGYPTQKPFALYKRIIKASSNEGDFVLDPFAGSASALVVAERLGRQWLGIDLWDGCHGIILDRLNREKQMWRPEDVNLLTTPPERTDATPPAKFNRTFRTACPTVIPNIPLLFWPWKSPRRISILRP